MPITRPTEPVTLSDRQERFCQEYIIDLNGTQAAIRAGYSEGGAHQEASRLLRIPKIRERVAALHLQREVATTVTAESVLLELAKIAMCDIGEAFDEHGALKPLKDMPIYIRKAIAGIQIDELKQNIDGETVTVGLTKRIRFWDKNRALEALGKHLRLFVDRIEHDVSDALADRLAKAQRRGDGDNSD